MIFSPIYQDTELNGETEHIVTGKLGFHWISLFLYYDLSTQYGDSEIYGKFRQPN